MNITMQMALKVKNGDMTRFTVEWSGRTTTERAKARTAYAVRVARIAGAEVTHLERRVRRGVYYQNVVLVGSPSQILGFSMVMDSLEIS